MTTVLGIGIVAAVLLAVPISYTKTTGYRATLEISDATGIDVKTVAGEFGKALDTENVMVRATAGGATISADVPVRSAGTLEGIASGFAQALTQRGVPTTAGVERLTERVTGNVYAMAANEIVEIRINSEGMTDEEIENEIRTQLGAAGLEACLVDVETAGGETRIEIGIGQSLEEGDACKPVRICIDGMEPPAGGECETQRAIEVRIAAEGKTMEEARAEARAHLEAMGFTDFADLEIEDCFDYYRVRLGGAADCCSSGGGFRVLGTPQTESKTLGEIKKEFTK